MKTRTYISSDGRVVYRVTGAEVDVRLMPTPEGLSYVEEDGVKYWTEDYVYQDTQFIHQPKPPTDHHLNCAARQQRAVLLSQSDWTQLPDVPIQTKEAWTKYRQELRDITDQQDYPRNIVWPVKPS